MGVKYMIHKNRGNRRWIDKRKRRSKYNLVQKIWGDATTFLDGILGKYDKGKIHDEESYKKTNNRVASKDHKGANRMGNNYSYSDKKKIESCNDKLEYYSSGKQEQDEFIDSILENDFYGDELIGD